MKLKRHGSSANVANNNVWKDPDSLSSTTAEKSQ